MDGNHIGDAPVLPDLLNQIPPDQDRPLSADCFAIACRATDGAYDTRKCRDAIADRGAHTVIPPRRNAKPCKPTTAGAVAVTKPCERRNIWGERFGETGVDITAEAVPRQR